MSVVRRFRWVVESVFSFAILRDSFSAAFDFVGRFFWISVVSDPCGIFFGKMDSLVSSGIPGRFSGFFWIFSDPDSSILRFL